MATDSNCPSLKNVMATESFALAPEKRYGHRLKLLRNPKNALATNSIALEWSPETLWPSSQVALELEKPYGHRLKLVGARIFRELGDSVTRKLKNLAQQKI